MGNVWHYFRVYPKYCNLYDNLIKICKSTLISNIEIPEKIGFHIFDRWIRYFILYIQVPLSDSLFPGISHEIIKSL